MNSARKVAGHRCVFTIALTIALTGLFPAIGHADAVSVTTVTFNRQIVRLLDEHCVMCHNANGPSFPLETYEQTFNSSRAIRASVLSRHMPPWGAVAGYGDFANGNSLTATEQQFVVSWVDGVAPRKGPSLFLNTVDPQAVAEAEIKAHDDATRWTLGKPDLPIQVNRIEIPAHANEIVKETVIDLKLRSDRWLRGLEYKPEARKVLRAAYFRVKESGAWIGSWTPWYGFTILPYGVAQRLAAGSHVVAELHYFGVKQPMSDSGTLGLYFSDKPSVRSMTTSAIAPKCTTAPTYQRCAAELRLDEDENVLALLPKVSAGVESIEVKALAADGATQVLLLARNIPATWPTAYELKRAAFVAKGTVLSVAEYYAAARAIPADGATVLVNAYAGATLPERPGDLRSVATAATPATPATPATAERRFALEGVVVSVDASSRTLVIDHKAIPGLMGAMTMSYRVGEREDVGAIRKKEEISAEVVVAGGETHLEGIKELKRAK